MTKKMVDDGLETCAVRHRSKLRDDVLGLERQRRSRFVPAVGIVRDRYVDWLQLRHVATRPRDQEALHEVAAGVAASVQLLDALNALSHDLGAENVRQLHDAGHEQALAPIALEAADEEAVDLHIVRLPFIKRLQSGKPGAEIVDGEPEAAPAQSLDRGHKSIVRRGIPAFGDLDAHIRGREPHLADAVEDRGQRH